MNWMKRAAAIVAAVWMSVAGAAVAAEAAAVFDVGTMHVERHGERGSPVILIPGLASGAWVWKDTIAALQGEHRVYAVTLAGFDGRPAVRGDVLALAATSLQELIVSQRLDKPVLVGHSLGGTLALMFAATHSDLIGGAVTGARDVIDRIRHLAIEQGTTGGAFEAWLVLRGAQTLALRVDRQCSNALALAESLAAHPKVAEVGYSGLADHPDHDRASALFDGPRFGAMLSFSLTGGYDAALRACDALRVARVGSSFGSMHSQVCHPATTSHRQLTAEEREAAGIGEGLIRVAVGGEDPEDLIGDFAQALEKA